MSNLRSVSGEAHVDEQLPRVQVTSDRLRTETIVCRCHRTRGHGDCRREGGGRKREVMYMYDLNHECTHRKQPGDIEC